MGIVRSSFQAATRLASRMGRSPAVEQVPGALVGLLVRADVERARIELRLGNAVRCEALLTAAGRRLGVDLRPVDGRPAPGADLAAAGPTARAQVFVLSGVVLSVYGQSMRSRGAFDRAQEAFRRAVAAFGAVGDRDLAPRDHADLGLALLALGQDSEAWVHLETAVEADAAPPEATAELARLQLAKGRTGKAERLIGEALQALPADPDLNFMRAETQRMRGNPLAASSFVQAVYLLLEAGRTTEALKALDEADRLRPESEDVIGLRGELFRMLGEFQAAIAAFDRALQVTPDRPWLLARRAAALAAVGQQERAVADLEREAELDSLDVNVLVLVGEVWLRLGQFAEARSVAARAMAVDRTAPAAIQLAALAWRASGDLDWALGLLRSAGPEVHSRPALLRLHADLALEVGEMQEAIDLLDWLRGAPEAEPYDLLRLAEALVDTGQRREALAVTLEGVEQWPADVQLRLLRAELLAEEDPAASLAHAEAALQLAPTSAAGHLLRAVALINQASPDRVASDRSVTEEALQAVARSAELAPDWAEPWYVQAQILGVTGDAEGARVAAEAALRRNEEHWAAQALLVKSYLATGDTGDLARAEEVARRLAFQPGAVVAEVVLLARVLVAAGRNPEALDVLSAPGLTVQDDEPALVEMLSLRAMVREALHDLTGALNDLERATELAPEGVDLWTVRASVARQLGDGTAAKSFAEQALQLRPGDRTATYELAAAHLLLFELDEARLIVERMAQRWPDDVEVALLGLSVLLDRDPERTLEEAARLAAAHPGDPDVTLAVARVQVELGEYEPALTALGALPDESLHAEALAVRAEALRLLGRPADAIEVADRCLQEVPDHIAALSTLGFALLDTGKDARAVEIFERAALAYPEDPVMKANLGQAYATAGRHEEALVLVDQAVSALPRSGNLVRLLADLLTDVGQFDQAAMIFQRICDGPDADVASWSGLGWALQHRQPPDLERAWRACETALALDPSDAWSKKNLANVYHVLGRTRESRRLYEEALQAATSPADEENYSLGLAAWCSFRLGDLAAAARALHEATTTARSVTSDHFDLALVHLCAGRLERGLNLYQELLNSSGQDPQRQRGLLSVARVDLEQARSDFPHLAGGKISDLYETLSRTIESLPPPPVVRAFSQSMPSVPAQAASPGPSAVPAPAGSAMTER